jgi:hypothetical protein
MAINVNSGINAATTAVYKSGATATAKVQTSTPEQVSRILYNSSGIRQEVIFSPEASVTNDSSSSLVYSAESNTFSVQKISVHGGFF